MSSWHLPEVLLKLGQACWEQVPATATASLIVHSSKQRLLASTLGSSVAEWLLGDTFPRIAFPGILVDRFLAHSRGWSSSSFIDVDQSDFSVLWWPQTWALQQGMNHCPSGNGYFALYTYYSSLELSYFLLANSFSLQSSSVVNNDLYQPSLLKLPCDFPLLIGPKLKNSVLFPKLIVSII